MEPSILKSTKKILGVGDDDSAFDLDILTHINSSFAIVSQIGVGPTTGFFIEDDTAEWADIDLPADQLALLRSYMFLKVRMLFDPPPTSFHIKAMEDQIAEHYNRLSYMREEQIPPLVINTPDELPAESAAGVQLTEVYVWIINHNLHFFPAAIKFYALDTEDELEPESVQYLNNDRILASWPVPTAGRWRVS